MGACEGLLIDNEIFFSYRRWPSNFLRYTILPLVAKEQYGLNLGPYRMDMAALLPCGHATEN